MAEEQFNPHQSRLDQGEPRPLLQYGRQDPWWRSQLTAEQERRFLLWFGGVVLALTVAWCLDMLLTCRPAADDLLVLGFASPLLAVTWVVLGWKLLKSVRRDRTRHPFLFWLMIAIAFFLGPYTFIRAGGDMFALSVRYHLWRAGGAQKVQTEFNQWLAARPKLDPTGREKFLFWDASPGGNMVPVPPAKLPPSVRYMYTHCPTRFGMSWDGVARLDNVCVLTTTDIMIGPPGWEPPDGATVMGLITGSRRKLADGIWLEVGTYDK